MNGGLATVENGANVEEIAHQFLHSLPRQKEEIVNNMLRDWKLNYIMLNGDEHGSIELSMTDDFIEIPLQKQEYNRARVKREFQKRVDEELER